MTDPRPLLQTGTAETWRPTAAHLRASVVAVVCLGVAVVAGRADLAVVGVPFAVVVAWSVATRPRGTPEVRARVGNAVLREGDATRWHGEVSGVDDADVVAAQAPAAAWFEWWPSGGVRAVTAGRSPVTVEMTVRSTRWGRRTIGPVRLTATSSFGAFQSAMATTHATLTTLPLPAAFDARAPVRTTDGLVGLARSSHVGEGGEFSSLRPFQVGDRTRRINWARSSRTDELQVNATWADQDTHVAFIIDASDDFGASDGIDGAASSLDTTVRAVGAIAEHHVRRGDRVSLRSFGTISQIDLPPGTGRMHLRRVLDTLTRLRPANDGLIVRRTRHRPLPVTGAALTVMLSPLVTRDALDRAVELGRHGLPVVVIDTLPDRMAAEGDAYTRLAWRIRLLDRRREIRRVQQAGIPVVGWHGPGSLDQFLRDVARRASAPRMRSR